MNCRATCHSARIGAFGGTAMRDNHPHTTSKAAAVLCIAPGSALRQKMNFQARVSALIPVGSTTAKSWECESGEGRATPLRIRAWRRTRMWSISVKRWTPSKTVWFVSVPRGSTETKPRRQPLVKAAESAVIFVGRRLMLKSPATISKAPAETALIACKIYLDCPYVLDGEMSTLANSTFPVTRSEIMRAKNGRLSCSSWQRCVGPSSERSQPAAYPDPTPISSLNTTRCVLGTT